MGSAVEAIFFDCDGVILQSVLLKEEAFRQIMVDNAPADKIQDIMEYFWANGGTSRLAKFRHIWANILNQPLDEQGVQRLGEAFTSKVYNLVVQCPFLPGAREFIEQWHDKIPMFVISGTPQPELQGIFRDRGISHYFKGVYGSPRNKVQVGEDIIAEHGYSRDGIWFLGDATTDRDAAEGLRTRFIGISGPHLDPYLTGDEIKIDDLTTLAQVLGLKG